MQSFVNNSRNSTRGVRRKNGVQPVPYKRTVGR